MKHCVGPVFRKRWMGSLSLMIFSVMSLAQEIPIGTWRTHFSFRDARLMAVTANKLFCASENGLFSRDLASGETRKLSKLDGLSDAGITALGYSEVSDLLILGYSSGRIDLIYEDRIETLNDLAATNLDVSKRINDVAFLGTKTYLATGLGVIVIDNEDATISENFIQIGEAGIDVEVLEVAIRNDSLFIRTEEGIQSGSISENLLDFSNWTRYAGTTNLANLSAAGGDLYARSGSRLWAFRSSGWEDTGVSLPAGADQLFVIKGKLYTASQGMVYVFDEGTFTSILETKALDINDLLLEDGRWYIADGSLGLIDAEGTELSPAGPSDDSFSRLKVLNDELFAFYAPSPVSYDGSSQIVQYSRFTNGIWQQSSIEAFPNVSDVADYNGSLYFSSIGKGLYNASLSEIVSDLPSRDTVITALATGSSLWVSSYDSNNPLHILSENEWQSFDASLLLGNRFLSIDISALGVGWIGDEDGLITVFEPVEAQISRVTGLPSEYLDIDISVEDDAWVATANGPAFFQSASFIFSDQNAILPSFENRTLFEGEQINAVLTDGGNRVWFGTENGLWVFDENTTERAQLFTTENSPLPSNRILQLAYNENNGEVFVATDKGMVSYRSASSLGSARHSNVNIFPNPVRPEYAGLVGLTGLANNVNIKVTDINGNLVTTLDANGGAASWNLRDVTGRTVKTGVYFFFSSTSDGGETFVGKIAVIR